MILQIFHPHFYSKLSKPASSPAPYSPVIQLITAGRSSIYYLILIIRRRFELDLSANTVHFPPLPPPSPLSPYRTLFPATHMRNTVLARITVACPDKPTTPYNCPSLSSVYRSPTIIVTISFRIIQPNGQ